MKLHTLTSVPMLVAAVSATITDEGDIRNIAHQCTDGSRDFVVEFNYNPTTEGGHAVELGDVMVGTCSGDQIAVVSDGDTHQITAPHPWDCGLEDNRTSAISSYSYDISFSFDAVFESRGIQIVQHSYVKTVGCQYADSYSASFQFNDDAIIMPGSDDGEVDGDTALSFEMASYTDNTYTEETANGTTLEAGNMAHLQVVPVGNFDSSIMEWSVANCKINETFSGVEYTLFDGAAGDCSNDQIFLSVSETDGASRVAYMIFLFDLPSLQQNYEINCDIEVCMKSAENSVCDQVSAACGFDDDENGST